MKQLSHLKLNGVLYEYKQPLSLKNMLEYLGFNAEIILLDYNGIIIPRSRWGKIILRSDDQIEVLTLAGGG